MEETLYSDQNQWPLWRKVLLIALLLATAGLSIVALLVPLAPQQDTIDLAEGDVAPRDILAPRTVSFESEVLTEAQREIAANAISPIYTPPDASAARQQVKKLRATLNFIESVRADSYATDEQKIADLAALQDVILQQESAAALVALSDASWQAVRQESIVVLEQVMRSTIRENRLEEARRSVPALVSLSLTEDQATLVAGLVSAFVAPNSLYNDEATQAARETAQADVDPIIRTYLTNETVVQRGEVVTAADLEALEQTGLLEAQTSWQDQVSAVALVVAVFTLIVMQFRDDEELLDDGRGLIVIAVLFLAFLFGARFTIPGHTVIPYIFPIAGFGMVVAVLFNTGIGAWLTIPLGILVAYGLPNALGLTLYYVLSGVFAALLLNRGQRISYFFWAGMAAAATGAVLVIAFMLPEPTMDTLGIVTLLGAAVIYGLASTSVTIVLQFFLSQILGMTTALQLLELARPDQPLLQIILRNSPGTYQHSLQVANLAEQAAELIGADALLTRVGALYHDAGKSRFPHFFIENQVPGSNNPHDDLIPHESAQVIIRHVPDGVELANKHRLPSRIKDFIVEHHGTARTEYQYAKAVEAVGGDRSRVDESEYRYPGPRPQSRETALVMLADGIEARSRAERPNDDEKIRVLVEDEVEKRISDKQLDDTTITMNDLKIATESFVTTLRGVYHPRINYPKLADEHKQIEGRSIAEMEARVAEELAAETVEPKDEPEPWA